MQWSCTGGLSAVRQSTMPLGYLDFLQLVAVIAGWAAARRPPAGA